MPESLMPASAEETKRERHKKLAKRLESLKSTAEKRGRAAKEREEKLPKETRMNLDRILEAYEEAENVDKFLDFMLERSDLALTQERVKNDAEVAKYLKTNFKEKELGARYEDFVFALPTEQDYIDKATGMEVEEADKPQKTKKILPKKSGETEEALAEIREMNQPTDETEEALAAVREMNMPPAAKTPRSLTELRKGIADSKNVEEYAGGLVEKRAEPVKKELEDIAQFFSQKYKDLEDAAAAHKFLMGAEIKGWFKGKQRKMQVRYKELFNSPVYKEWLKMKGKR